MPLFDPEPPPVVTDSLHPAFDPYYEWLSISPSEQPPNHYCLLGITLYEDNSEVISNAADRQAAHLRSFQLSEHVSDSEKLLAEVFKARACLLDTGRKADYDQELKNQLDVKVSSITPLAPSTFIRRRSRRRKKKSAFWEMSKILFGGVIGSVLAVLILWHGFGKDPFGIMAPKLPKTASSRARSADVKIVKLDKAKRDALVVQRKVDELRAENINLKRSLAIKSSKGVLNSSEWTDLLERVDVDKHAVGGTWSRDRDGIIVEPAAASRITIPSFLNGSYKLTIEFTRHTGNEAVDIILPVCTTSCVLTLSGWNGAICGLGLVDGKPASAFPENHERAKKFKLHNNRRYRCDISVTVHGDTVTIDSQLDRKSLLNWNGKINQLSMYNHLVMPNRNSLGLGAYNIKCTFHRVELRVLDSADIVTSSFDGGEKKKE